jgi:hypothetical protein
MNFIPKRKKRPKMGVRQDDGRIHCEAHKKWCRGFTCVANGRGPFPCEGRIEAHHTKTRGAWGGDETVVPLCAFHHAQLDSPGWSQRRFEQEYAVNFNQLAADLWARSPHGKRYRAERVEP